MEIKKLLFLCVIAMVSTVAWAQKIDFNLPGRQASQVTETGYTPWAVTTGVKESLVPDSTKALKITIANGPNSAVRP